MKTYYGYNKDFGKVATLANNLKEASAKLGIPQIRIYETKTEISKIKDCLII